MSEVDVLTQELAPVERRSHQRAPLVLPARYLLPSGEEVECVTTDVSANGVTFRTARSPRIGDVVIAYIRDLGRVQGEAVRYLGNGFAMTISSTALKSQRLAEKIAQLTNGMERRLFPRLEVNGAQIQLRTADGATRSVEIVDVSTMGVAFRGDLALNIGEHVEIGGRAAVVARLFKDGAAASFL